MAMRKWESDRRVVVLDLEFTNISPKSNQYGLSHEVLQFGAVMLNDQYEIIDRFNALLRPAFSSDQFEARKDRIINTSDRSVLRQGRIGKVYRAFCEWIGINPVDVLVWSTTDYRILTRELEAKVNKETMEFLARYMDYFIDLQKVLMEMLDAPAMPSLDYAMELVHEKYRGTRHNAYDDAENTARLFARLHRQCRLDFNARHIRYEDVFSSESKEDRVTVAELTSFDYDSSDYAHAEDKERETVRYGADKRDTRMLSRSTMFTPGIKGEHKVLDGISRILGRSNAEASCSSGDYTEYRKQKTVVPSFREYLKSVFPDDFSTEEIGNIGTGFSSPEVFGFCYLTLVHANFAYRSMDTIPFSEISGFCRHAIKTKGNAGLKNLCLLRYVLQKASKDGFPFSASLMEINSCISKAGAKERFNDALVRLFCSEWENGTHKAIAETIALTGYDISYMLTMNGKHAHELLGRLESGNWLNDRNKDHILSLRRHLANNIFEADKFVFAEMTGNFPSEIDVNQSIENELKRLKIKYSVNIGILKNYGMQHVRE